MDRSEQHGQLTFAIACAVAIVAPLVWHVVLAFGAASRTAPPSYLPALELTRLRDPFQPIPMQDLRDMQPGYVTIGDSMAGRIDPERLAELTKQTVAPLLQNATGSCYWFLTFKNYVVASGIKPKWVVVFFRDTNLTDPFFRLTGPYRGKLDEVATTREDELNTVLAARQHGPWLHLYRGLEATYEIESARAALEPALVEWPARLLSGPRAEHAFLDDVDRLFDLDRLRPIPEADAEAANDRDTDFAANVTTSVLPLFIRLAAANDLHLCFVRVLRRTEGGHLPPESPGLRRYVGDLRAYLDAHGALFRDDRNDPDMASIPYGDGDHIAGEARRRYTELFYAHTPALFR